MQTVVSGPRSYVGLAEFGMLAKIGLNSAGLGIHFNLLRHVSDAQPGYDDGTTALRAGVPVHLVAAAILGEATTVAEAVELVRSAPIAASTVITVVTPDEAACMEMSPAGVGVVEPSDGWLVHTNHFLDPRLAEGEAVTEFVTTTFERQDLLSSRVKATPGPLDLDGITALLCAHDEDGVSVCRHPIAEAPHGYRSATLATVALDVRTPAGARLGRRPLPAYGGHDPRCWPLSAQQGVVSVCISMIRPWESNLMSTVPRSVIPPARNWWADSGKCWVQWLRMKVAPGATGAT